ncbi:LytTR family DNA-binding domain-containing protein [Pendulispora rubella]|uniref:LytTR family DNA-binding domain-containing protein n=1 Tax=Pendulispora rubella TaxID=2741070 RepID=A0ABZ2L4A7_9BACT
MISPQLRALVVEDEWPARNYLVELLQRTSSVDVVAAVATLDEATQTLERLEVDAVFVDIMLSGKSGDTSGLDWIKTVSRTYPLQFVLATALPEHALSAFDLGVSDYLLKPFTAPRVAQSVERLLAKRPAKEAPLEPAGPRRIVARDGSSLVFVPLEEVLAFEAAARLCFAHCAGGRFSVDLSLSALETAFEGTFLRVHRNWLVQPALVRRYVKEMAELLVQLGERSCLVPVSRDRSQAVKDALFANAVGLRRGGAG